MPRVTAAHEQQVRDRIIAAALMVFDEHGYHRATMQDVVRASGLSVGAIYTYFRARTSCSSPPATCRAARGLGELADRLARAGSTAEKLAIAIGFFLDTMDADRGRPAGLGHVPRPGLGGGSCAGGPRDARPAA